MISKKRQYKITQRDLRGKFVRAIYLKAEDIPTALAIFAHECCQLSVGLLERDYRIAIEAQ